MRNNRFTVHVLAIFYGGGSNEDRSSLFMCGQDVPQQRFHFSLLCAEDSICIVSSSDRQSGRNGQHLQLVHILELRRLGKGRPRHAREFGEQAKEILVGHLPTIEEKEVTFQKIQNSTSKHSTLAVTCVSSDIVSPSLASMLCWSPSLNLRPSRMRPVNESTIITALLTGSIMYS